MKNNKLLLLMFMMLPLSTPVVAEDDLSFLFDDEEVEAEAVDSQEADSEEVDSEARDLESESTAQEGSSPSELDEAEAEPLTSNQTDAAPDANAPVATPPASGGKRITLEEIVVTSQRREQSIQDVPVSVSSLTGEMMDDLNMENMNDLSKVTPNLKISADGIYNTISIRGLGSGTNNGFEQSVGTFTDDVYFGNTARLLSSMYDLDRIEVLRGPQGTLFGRNTIAGAIAIHTAEVSEELEASLDSTLGQLDWSKHTVVGNIPMLDGRLGLRLAAHYFEREGHVRDRFLDKQSGNTRSQSGRAKLRYDISDAATLTMTYQVLKNTLAGQGDQLHHVPEEWITYLRDYDPEIEGELDDFGGSSDYESGGDLDFSDLIVHFDVNMFNHDFVAIIADSNTDRVGGLDADFTPVSGVLGEGIGGSDEKSIELRMVSEPGDFEYIGGLYYFNLERFDLTDTYINLAAFVGATASGGFVSVPGVGLISSLVGVGAVNDAKENDRKRGNFKQFGDSYAAYGQITWSFAEKWSLLAGGRYSLDYKNIDFKNELTAGDGSPSPAVGWRTILSAEEFHIFPSRTDESFTPKVSMVHYLTDDLTTYATYAEGFKAGGYNGSANKNADIEFEEETSKTYEMGIKGSYLDGAARLNLSLFRTEFDDLQVTAFNGLEYIVDNAAAAISQGVELEGMMILPAGFLLTGTYAFLDAYYDSFPGGPCQTQHRSEQPGGSPDFCDIGGEQLAGSPRNQFTIGANYVKSFDNWDVDFVAGVDYYWQDDVYFQTDLDPEDFQEAYSLWNGRFGIRANDDRWAFTVFVKNITDEVVLTSSTDVPIFSGAHVGPTEAPRTITSNFKVRF